MVSWLNVERIPHIGDMFKADFYELIISHKHMRYTYFFFLWRYSPNLGLGLPP
jgi:hypothetical protein